MKKILLMFSCIILGCSNVFAEPVNTNTAPSGFVETHTTELLDKIKTHRDYVYSTLNLSEEQIKLINIIDTERYKEVEPALRELSQLVKKLEDLANSENCTIRKVNKVKKEFKPVQKNLYSITKKYENELKTILTPEQNIKYENSRKQIRDKIRNNQH